MTPFVNNVNELPDDYKKIAICESAMNPKAVNASGKYRGMFQFDNRSWQWVGGSGDPARASVREQLRRAQELVKRQGFSRAFPQCSRIMGVK